VKIVRNYEIRFVRKDRRAALVCATRCYNDLDARVVARRMLTPEFAYAELWHGMEQVDVIRDAGPPLSQNEQPEVSRRYA
jgi:hypothetical protein